MNSRTKQEQRKANFKKIIDSEDSRRKREDAAVEIRKSKRDESLQQKRRITASSGQSGSSALTPTQNEVSVGVHVTQQFINAVVSNDANQWLEGTIAFRKLLSIERNPPIQEVINAGVIPRFVYFLQSSNLPKLQFEAAWALTNIASGTTEQTQELLRHGAVAVFVQLLSSGDEELREQAVWALGNIAGDSPKCRDFVLQTGALGPILFILQNNYKQTMQRNATWALSNLCRGKPQPNFASVAPAIPILARLIHSADNEVVIDATWALSYISDGTEQNIEAVINAGVAHRLVELLTHSSHTVQTPALRTVGNIVTGNDEQTQTILDLRALPILYQLLQSGRKALRKEACWTISNITAGNREQTNSVIKANLIPPLLNLLSNGEFDVKKEAAWAISNATSWKNPEQIRHLVNSGAIKPLCDLLKANDVKTIVVALEALDNILSVGEKIAKGNESNGFTAIVEEAEGIDRLEELQAHENHEIYDKAVKILERYFGAEEEDENLAPNVAANQQVFNFGGTFQAPVGGFSF